MSAGCDDTLGSNTKLVIFPEPDCAPAPKLHNLVVDAAAAVGATQISVVLQAASHTSTDKIPLSPGTFLTIGTQVVEVVEPPNGTAIYILSLVPQLITVKRLKAAIAVNAAFTNYCFLRTCLTSNNIETSTESVDNTTNCTGVLFTKLNVGYGKMIKLAGFNRSKDYAYYILKKFGKDLKTFWFALDYDGRFLVTGQFQGTDPSVTDGAVKNIVKWNMDGQVQQIDYDGSNYVETAADLVALEALRANYGFGKSVGVQVIPA
jgi:hypothetical protein